MNKDLNESQVFSKVSYDVFNPFICAGSVYVSKILISVCEQWVK